MELLAPVGSPDHFGAAVEAGADGVYVGAPGFNARNPVREFSFADIRAMADYCRARGLAFYVALNSLVREEELPALITTLAELESISPSALIVQDLGVIELVTSHFPSLRLHGSTLMFAHNSAGVEALAEIGCSRVVLARELTLGEIAGIIKRSSVEIEIFIHGAMCYSYSGGCLFSSYHGGKSGLRGNCVQPCRRKYTISSAAPKKKKSRAGSAYLFSMNDLEGLDLVDDFRQIGVASLKIEGRLRSVNYVDQVVRAYRMVMDAGPAERDDIRMHARELIQSALGRKSSAGFFLGEKGRGTISPHHSGNIGTYCGRFSAVTREGATVWGTIRPKHQLVPGERFRLHDEKSGERLGFTLKNIEQTGARDCRIELPGTIRPDMSRTSLSLYRVDVSTPRRSKEDASGPHLAPVNAAAAETASIRKKSRSVIAATGLGDHSRHKTVSTRTGRGSRRQHEVWLRVDSPRLVFQKLPFAADRFVLPIEKRTVAEAGQLKKYFGREKQRLIWALPSVVHDQSWTGLRKKIDILVRSGYRTFQISHLGQMAMFGQARVSVFGDYTLNLLNSRSLRKAVSTGLAGVQFCIEADRDSLAAALESYRAGSIDRSRPRRGRNQETGGSVQLGFTVYGSPPLFTSRAEAEHLPYNQTIASPKGELFSTTRRGGLSYTRAARPFSLLPFRNELLTMGIDYLVIDLSGMKTGKRELEDVAGRLSSRDRPPRLPTFNYLGTLE